MLLKSTPSTFLYDKNIGYGLNHFKAIHQTHIITNAMVLFRSTGQVGALMKSFSTYFQNKNSLPLPIEEAPIIFSPSAQNRSYFKNLSTILYQNDLRLRNLNGSSQTNHLYDKLSIADYQLYYKELKKLEITNTNDIMKYNDNNTLPFNNYVTKIKNAISQHEYIENFPHNAPEAYNSITNAISRVEARLPLGQMKIMDSKHKADEINSHFPMTKDVLTNFENLDIYIAGASKNENFSLGAAAVFVYADNRIDTLQTKFKPGTHSKLTAEKFAIYSALRACPNKQTKIRFLSDSKTALKSIILPLIQTTETS